MKLTNPIGWCDDTTNAVTGCDKVSPGCKNCYAQVGTRARVLRHRGIETWGPNATRYPVAEFAKKIRRLNKLCICDLCGETAPFARLVLRGVCECGGLFRRIRLFADSNSDWLDRAWMPETLADCLGAINDAPNVDVLLLTKRIELWEERVMAAWDTARAAMDMIVRWTRKTNPIPPPNLWLGVSVEDQKRANERIPQLLATPAAVRFLSVEPLLEQVDLSANKGHDDGMGLCWDWTGRPVHVPHCDYTALGRQPPDGPKIDWVIVGGESGANRRDCGVEAIIDVAAQCAVEDVPCYVKQDCSMYDGRQGRLPDGVWNIKEFPMQPELASA